MFLYRKKKNIGTFRLKKVPFLEVWLYVVCLQEYRRKIDCLEQAELEKDALKDENFRLREEMQSR